MVEISKEDLSQMTPDQIAALQKQNCIFCHIINGKVSSKKIFEDDRCIAILDINPANPGHVLLLPKEHYSILPLIPDDLVQHLGQVAKHISQACLRVLRAQGTDIFVANGAVAGQKAPHFMIHIIPRRDNDDVSAFRIPRKRALRESLLRIYEKVLPVSSELLGFKPEKKPVVDAPSSQPAPAGIPQKPGDSVPAAKKQGADLPAGSVPSLRAPSGPLPKLNIDALANAILNKPELTMPSSGSRAASATSPPAHASPSLPSSPQPPSSSRRFVASTHSNRVHAPNCPLARKIKQENRVWFSTKQEALDMGYEECDCVKGGLD
ncbi:HIT domain-containing protein [Candidatus Woesearchaeota archaeon]|nr:MAG: HIT domain-containing protein [Candidatus Woesearchaeota archaeon]